MPIEIYGAFLGDLWSLCYYVLTGYLHTLTVDRPTSNDFNSVRESLLKMIVLCLDSDPSLVPMSTPGFVSPPTSSGGSTRDPDDFSFWSPRQAKRIATAIKEAFGVDYAPEVVIGDANVSALASRVVASLQILSS